MICWPRDLLAGYTMNFLYLRERLFAEAGGQARGEGKQTALPGNPTPENFPVNLSVHLLNPETSSLITIGPPNTEAASECLLGKDHFPALVFRKGREIRSTGHLLAYQTALLTKQASRQSGSHFKP